METISLKEARKLLGQKSKNLTDEELESLLNDVEAIVRISVRNCMSSKNGKSPVNMANNMENKV
ncbi:MAG TPA: hypothetical protein VGE13_00945 [Candidatus Saccharimonadales bacterium]